MLTVLYVESNDDFRKEFEQLLIANDYKVDSVADPITALEILSRDKYNLVISGLDYKTIGGFRFQESALNINPDSKRVIFTNEEDPKKEILAINANIDLFLLKSRGKELALKKIKQLESDIAENSIEESYLLGEGCDLKMNLINHNVSVKGEFIHLTPKEFEILRLLLENKGKYLSRKFIIDEVWDNAKTKEVRIVDTHIKKIREKTGCFEITTVRGYGYMWRD